MTRMQFVTRNAFRNRRRTLLTVGSMGFSLLLLTLMITMWRNFYDTQPSDAAAQRLIVRNKVSLAFYLPAYYREKIRAIAGVKHVVNSSWFGGKYKDDKPENFFAQFATDPNELFEVYADFKIPPDQLRAWQKDRAGAVVDAELAQKHGWKIGDQLNITGVIFPLNLELTIRGIYTAPQPTQAVYFNQAYLDEGYPEVKGHSGFFAVLVDSPDRVSRVATIVDDEFRNVERPTKSESEHAFQLGFLAMLGNVKAFILSICAAVVFAILLVSANTMAMSVRERVREVALLKTLGFTRRSILAFFVAESVTIALAGGLLGVLAGTALITLVSKSPSLGFFGNFHITSASIVTALAIAALVGFGSAFLPSYHASRMNIVEGLRHVG